MLVRFSVMMLQEEAHPLLFPEALHKAPTTALAWPSLAGASKAGSASTPFGDAPFSGASRSRAVREPPPLPSDGGFSQFDSPGAAVASTSAEYDAAELNFLVSGDAQGVLALRAFGDLPVALVDVSTIIGSTCAIKKVCLAGNAARILLVVDVLTEDGASTGCLRLVTLDTHRFKDAITSISGVAKHCVTVARLLAHAHATVELMASQWAGATKQLSDKLDGLKELLRQYGQETTPREELARMLSSGSTSGALSQFLQTTLTESGLSRLHKALDAACANIESLAVLHAARSCEGILLRLSDSRGLARWKERYSAIGWHVEHITPLIHTIEGALLKIEEVRCLVAEARALYDSLFRWLRRIVRIAVDGTAPAQPVVTKSDLMRVAAALAPTGEAAAPGSGASGAASGGADTTWDPLLPFGVRVHINGDPSPGMTHEAGIAALFRDAAVAEMVGVTGDLSGTSLHGCLVSFDVLWSAALGGIVEATSKTIGHVQTNCPVVDPAMTSERPAAETGVFRADCDACVVGDCEYLGFLIPSPGSSASTSILVVRVDSAGVSAVPLDCPMGYMATGLAMYADSDEAAGEPGVALVVTKPPMSLPGGAGDAGDAKPEDGVPTRLALLPLKDLAFVPVELGEESGPRGSLLGAAVAACGMAEDMVPAKCRLLPAASAHHVVVQGSRGAAAILCGDRRMMVYDLEGHEEEEHGEGGVGAAAAT